MNARLLLVEDDPALTSLMTWHFEREDFKVVHTRDGDDALRLAAANPPDIMLLDWMIEGISGIEVCRRLRQSAASASLPIMMLSGRGEEADRIEGLRSGADDYVPKPFSPREVVARVRALLRRRHPALLEDRLQFADLEMDVKRHTVSRAGRSLALGPGEFRLLRYLLEHPRTVFSRERLLHQVWGPGKDYDIRTVDVQVRRLRLLLNAGGRRQLVRTVRSAGYSLDDG